LFRLGRRRGLSLITSRIPSNGAEAVPTVGTAPDAFGPPSVAVSVLSGAVFVFMGVIQTPV